jgi:hypothetical protein
MDTKDQTFYFVDSSNSSSREKRAHVMRHHIENKRKRLHTSHGNIDSDSDRTVKDPGDCSEYEPSTTERNESESTSGDGSSV